MDRPVASDYRDTDSPVAPQCDVRLVLFQRARAWLRRQTGHDAVRIVLGLFLLTAAALKGHQLATEPVAETSLLTSRWFLIVVVEFELFFGLWLMAGLYPKRTWYAALLCFGGFSCISLYKALSGEATCGCFGTVEMSPWYTFGLDTAAVIALSWCRPQRGLAGVFREDGRLLFRPAEVAIVCLAVGAPSAWAMGSYQAAAINETGDISGQSGFVVLEPETWIGKRLPILNHIDIADQLDKGHWIVILYHHQCPVCRKLISKHEQLPRVLGRLHDAVRVALVEIPPRSGIGIVPSDSLSLLGNLSEARQWFVATPTVLYP